MAVRKRKAPANPYELTVDDRAAAKVFLDRRNKRAAFPKTKVEQSENAAVIGWRSP